ncbi:MULTISPECIES: TRAP transporter large permease [Halomonas]|uniref:TRAP transporter large permease n=1 Tax=Halomonas TaxID=2745 RepID=UPI001C97CF2F|nr:MULTISPECIES: TRAP transporter large permease [Halomonas]MBY6206037.1 TRAP transporter large permease [Halomonas sp. DP3Y7-2]MBY6228072.1 TRAP transporter large permease [Halomonas sp. DP3Y7-1]MCA0916138.1 TRAP transporter large permease [Halomonas denitrificans]
MISITEVLLGFALMITMMAVGIHVAVAIFVTAALGALLYLGTPLLYSFGDLLWGTLNDFILTAIPLFILLGELLLRAGITERMYSALSVWLNRLPGGLLHTNIGASSVFAAMSGSSVATAATIGTVALPAFNERGYSERLALGTLAAGATLGILIPPSINMIIYGAITNTSIGALFIAGIVPGLALAAAFMLVIMAISLLRPGVAGSREERVPLAQRLRSLVDLLPPAFVFAIVIGSIYSGWATPTEAAALGVIAALVLAAINRKLSLTMLHECFLSMARTTAMIMLIIAAAFFLNYIVGILGIPFALTQWVSELGLSSLGLILALVVFYLVLGCFLETLSMMIATVPIVVPMVVQFGIDPVWFGVFLVIMMEISLITPPIGMNLYVVQGVRGRGSIVDVMLGSLPFLAVMLGFVALITAWPAIVLWLPGVMG